MLALIIVLALTGIATLLISMVVAESPNQADHATEAILSVLPQTQCGKCGYLGCRPYAYAISRGEIDINLCTPGGDPTVKKLASMLGVPAKSLDPNHLPTYDTTKMSPVALIDEMLCIGCTLCIKACPTDAILGAAKQMHTVLMQECTGCELCLPPCPMDCISIKFLPKTG
ncbi:Electron transport complex protein RnfB [uncultured Candidatus Thioglobus sp.]|nr:Electron transport complex protein RnfB [uncultured Candidatus Thioglobus sp.]